MANRSLLAPPPSPRCLPAQVLAASLRAPQLLPPNTIVHSNSSAKTSGIAWLTNAWCISAAASAGGGRHEDRVTCTARPDVSTRCTRLTRQTLTSTSELEHDSPNTAIQGPQGNLGSKPKLPVSRQPCSRLERLRTALAGRPPTRQRRPCPAACRQAPDAVRHGRPRPDAADARPAAGEAGVQAPRLHANDNAAAFSPAPAALPVLMLTQRSLPRRSSCGLGSSTA